MPKKSPSASKTKKKKIQINYSIGSTLFKASTKKH